MISPLYERFSMGGSVGVGVSAEKCLFFCYFFRDNGEGYEICLGIWADQRVFGGIYVFLKLDNWFAVIFLGV
ncbi:MAG: hypothetical protein D6797_04095 [Bdellovibrio sp.]|nr:MAG: hypothetical protein D6797_04095 [Bdellovibrio sp.]